jgi:predicted small secreted protein
MNPGKLPDMKKLIAILFLLALCIGLSHCTNDERNTGLDILTPNDSLNTGVEPTPK